MAEQIEGIEIVLFDRESLGEGQEVASDPVMLLKRNLAVAPATDRADNGSGADEIKRNSGNDLEQGMQALGEDADDEQLMDSLFLHEGRQRPDFRFRSTA